MKEEKHKTLWVMMVGTICTWGLIIVIAISMLGLVSRCANACVHDPDEFLALQQEEKARHEAEEDRECKRMEAVIRKMGKNYLCTTREEIIKATEEVENDL
jgi:hypothetical protein